MRTTHAGHRLPPPDRRQQLGRDGEAAARAALRSHGYVILAERYRVAHGEIAKSSGAVFFVWTLLALGVCALFSVILSAHGLWKLQRGRSRKPELESRQAGAGEPRRLGI